MKLNGPIKVKTKQVGILPADIVAINPTKEELEKFGFKPKNEPVYDIERNVPVLETAPGEYTVVSSYAKRFEERYRKLYGKELDTDKLMVEDTVKAQGKRYTFVFKEMNSGEYLRLSYEHLNDERLFNMPRDLNATFHTNTNGYTAQFLDGKSWGWNNKIKKYGWVEDDVAKYPYPGVHETHYDPKKRNGNGIFAEFLQMWKSYLISVGATDDDGIPFTDHKVDFLGSFGGEDLLNGDVSIMQQTLEMIHEETKPKARGVFLVKCLFIDYKGRQFNRLSTYSSAITFKDNGELNYPIINSKLRESKKFEQAGLLIPNPVPQGLKKVDKKIQAELYALNDKLNGKNSYTKPEATEASATEADESRDTEDLPF